MNSSAKLLCPVVEVDLDKCVNCHACIAVCPVKDCNHATPEGVILDSNLCIGCGECIDACRHDARKPIDDFATFMQSLRRKDKWIAIVAPAVAASFPNKFLHLNGWLQSLGVAACFDVSFGAELTVKSYLEAMKSGHKGPVIAQPCPAIVTYIETYRPELIEYLAPAHSPMGHVALWIRNHHPEFKAHKIAVISPCTAKKREFEATGFADANVTMRAIDEYLRINKIDLGSYRPVDYRNPPIERALMFSSPGGLLATAERWNPKIGGQTRKIEGPQNVYHYLDQLPNSIRNGTAPALIDCLNCEHGCNGGTGTNCRNMSADDLEAHIKRRRAQVVRQLNHNGQPLSDEELQAIMLPIIEQNWDPELFLRAYEDRSAHARYKKPSPAEREAILHELGKFQPEDIKHCHACGYKDCDKMVDAIFNGWNRPENCHFYREFRVKELQHQIAESFDQLAERFRAHSADATALRPIVREVSKITMQSHMLAVNGAVEAARAGEFGRGFSVISEEMRSLSEQTRSCSDDIEAQIAKILRAFQNVEAAINVAAEQLKSQQSKDEH